MDLKDEQLKGYKFIYVLYPFFLSFPLFNLLSNQT